MKSRVVALLALFTFCQLSSAKLDWTVSWKFEAHEIGDGISELRAAGQTVLRLRSDDAFQQIQRLANRLNELLWQRVKPEAIVVNQVPGGFTITVNGEPLLTVTHQIARAAQSDPKALANLWAQKLREVFSWHWLAVPMNELVVAVGEEVTVQLIGMAEGEVQVEANPPEIVKLKVGTDGRSVVVTGIEAGAGILRIVKGRVGIRLPFRTLYRAATWKKQPTAWVRSAQVSAAMVREAVENAIMMTLDVQVGARWVLLPFIDSVNFFPANTVTRWRVQAMGDQFLPLDEIVNVPLQSFPQSLGEADLLVISNEPETFRDFRVLCRGLLQPSQTTRFMIHHRNGINRPAWLVLEFRNTEDRWAPLLVRFGHGEPNESELKCGHQATASFLHSLLYDSAIRIYLPPQSVYRLLRFGLKHRDTASALVEARLEEAAGVSYQVVALPVMPPKTELLSGTQLVESLMSLPDPPPYSKPVRRVEETHIAGKQWTFISVGRFGLEHPLKGRVLQGNYGVIYRISVKFVNPTNRSWRAQLVVEPAGGVMRGAFLVDGRLVEVPLLRPGDERMLHEFTLAPNQTKIVNIVTVPSAGSFYPIQIVARTQ
ncbi:MAG: hypothetical protein ACUVTP_02545 [Candidatus Fervidibacter sp.]|uniref:hypothetical protein n=1 Tax=Candidatus Fervidibacter sp. TaxID=3100871 RepID=UPI004048EC17